MTNFEDLVNKTYTESRFGDPEELRQAILEGYKTGLQDAKRHPVPTQLENIATRAIKELQNKNYDKANRFYGRCLGFLKASLDALPSLEMSDVLTHKDTWLSGMTLFGNLLALRKNTFDEQTEIEEFFKKHLSRVAKRKAISQQKRDFLVKLLETLVENT